MLPEGSGTGFQVGQRVQSGRKEGEKSCTKQSGTVKYIGPVEGYDGLWIGVDWDSGHGRHDGTVNGKRYFQTATKESGSLVRPSSLSAGITLAEALIERYNASATTTSSGGDGMYVLSVRHRRMNVELVGKDRIEEKQKRTEELKVVILAYAGVRSAGPPGEVGGLSPSLKELDLTGNLLPNWEAVGDICEELPSLRFLNLSCSRITLEAESIVPSLSKIQTLVLNNCNITWQQVEKVKLSLKSLEELHLSGNRIKTIEVSEQGACGNFVEGFETLRLLNLEDNEVEDWGEVIKVSKLKRLEHLNLNSNKLEEVTYPDLGSSSEEYKEGEQSVPFYNLRCLLLGKNKIASMDSVNALNHFQSLKLSPSGGILCRLGADEVLGAVDVHVRLCSLHPENAAPDTNYNAYLQDSLDVRLSENPLMDPSLGMAARYFLVARIGNITNLNGSEVKPRERKEAEIRYVRNVLKTISGKIDDAVLKMHPRFMELKAKHDVSVESGKSRAALASNKMSQSLLPVTLMCVSLPMKNRTYVTRNLPPSTTIGRLKQVCEALFRVKAANQLLYIKDEEHPLPILLVNDLESITDVGIGEDSRILVDEAKELKYDGECERQIRGQDDHFKQRIESGCESRELGQILEDIKKHLEGDVGVSTFKRMQEDTEVCLDMFDGKGLIHRLLECG